MDELDDTTEALARGILQTRVAFARAEDLTVGLLFEVLDDEQLTPQSAVYLAQRGAATRAWADASEALGRLAAALTTAEMELSARQVATVVVIDALTIESSTTQLAEITTSGETFTVRAVVRNLTMSSLEPAATATITSGVGFSFNRFDQPAQTIAAGGTGTFTWTLTHDGGDVLLTPRGTVRVELREPDFASATSFFEDAASTSVTLASALEDTDDDGLPDAFERRYGLMIGTDDRAADPDGDGISNQDERARGTDPSRRDMDLDGLDDGEETTLGADQVVTDRIDPDSDKDGVRDSDDPQPTSLLDRGTPREEPELGALPSSTLLTPFATLLADCRPPRRRNWAVIALSAAAFLSSSCMPRATSKMDENRFWTIAGAGASEPEPEHVVAAELKKLTPAQLVAYQEFFDRHVANAYQWELWGACYVLGGR